MFPVIALAAFFPALAATPMSARPLAAAAGEVVVENTASSTVRVMVDGKTVGALPAGKTGTYKVEPGSHEVVVAMGAFGESFPLQTRSVQVRAGVPATLTAVEPTVAPVQVRNHTGRDAILYVNGVAGSPLADGEQRILGLPLGEATVELRRPGGRLLDRETVVSTAFVAPTLVATLDYGALRVHTPHDDALALRVAGENHPIAPGQELLIDALPIGATEVDLLLPSGLVYGQERLRVGAGKAETLRMSAPIDKALTLVSRLSERGEVFIDGVRHSVIEAGQRAQLDLAPGSHRVVVRDEAGEAVFMDRVEVHRKSPGVLVVDPASRKVSRVGATF
jgi:hypothetical protein